jgi:broad specificity phosphatase PhoE/predicted kinase
MSLGIPIAIAKPLAVVMVGLPARGKTYIARKLARYLSWTGYRAEVFNVGNYRRERFGAKVPASFFDPTNTQGLDSRKKAAFLAMDDMLTWFRDGGEIGIYDATNSTQKRRAWVMKQCDEAGVDVLFVETLCDDATIIDANIRDTKLLAPDYQGIDPDQAVADFRARIAHYERAYEPIACEQTSFVKLINVGQRIEAQHVQGYIQGRITQFVMNLHITPRTIWLTRHGESTANMAGVVGTDMPLTSRGAAYAKSLATFIGEQLPQPGTIWTSTLQRAIQTAAPLGRTTHPLKVLDEIDAGICDGMTYAQIQEQMPGEFARRSADKLGYRYPRGESYEDVIARLDPLILELERQQNPVLVVSHNAILRVLYGYLSDAAREAVPHIDVPLHTVMSLTPRAYGCEVKTTVLDAAV